VRLGFDDHGLGNLNNHCFKSPHRFANAHAAKMRGSVALRLVFLQNLPNEHPGWQPDAAA
jgi:hypothetical protein